MSKNKTTDSPVTESKKGIPTNGFYGVLLLFVVASIVYSTATIIMGTTGVIPKALIAPQALFAAIVLMYKFVK